MAYQKPSKGQPRKANDLHRNAAFFGDLVDVVGNFKAGRRPPSGGSAFDRRGPMVFIRNDTGANLKLGEVVELGDYLLDEEDPYKWWLEGNAVSNTFTRRFAVAAEPIEEDAIGAAWVRGPAVIRYAGTAPSSGDGLGPKPSTVTLEKGYPCFAIVDDIIDTSEKLLLGTLGEIREVFGKPQSDISAATSTTQPSTGTVIVQYFDGTSYAATTFEMTGTNILPYKIKAGRLYKWVAVGDQWCAVELASRVWEGSIGSTCAAGASTTVTLADGTSFSGKNVSGQLLQSGAVLAADDAYSGSILICGSAEPSEGDPSATEVWAATAEADIAAGASGNILLPDATRGTAGVVSATNWSDYRDVADNEKIIAWQDPTDDNYYFLASSPRISRWFKGALSAALASSSGTASVDGIAALDGGSAPTTATVKNPHSLAGLDNGDVLFVEDWDDLDESDDPTYILVQVKHVAQTVVTDYRYDTSSHKLQKKTRDVVLMVDGAESAWTDVQTFTGYTMISAIDWNDPDLQRKTRVVYSPETASESSYSDVDNTEACDD